MPSCRLLIDGPSHGAWNMAVDEALLHAATDHPENGAFLRFYRWAEPTISLGYFQSADDVPLHLSSLPMVRRLSGGGAIVHDRELTYSLAIPVDLWPTPNFLDVVRDVHGAINTIFPGLHVAQPIDTQPEPFLCFERRSPQDLVFGTHKIVGSAQRNRRGVLLQHGSILQQRSAATSHLLGLADLITTPPIEDWIEPIVRILSQKWAWKIEPGSASEPLLALSRELDTNKYATPAWTLRR